MQELELIFPVFRIGDGQCGLQYDLDAPEEGGICVNIFPVLTKETDPNVPSSRFEYFNSFCTELKPFPKFHSLSSVFSPF